MLPSPCKSSLPQGDSDAPAVTVHHNFHVWQRPSCTNPLHPPWVWWWCTTTPPPSVRLQHPGIMSRSDITTPGLSFFSLLLSFFSRPRSHTYCHGLLLSASDSSVSFLLTISVPLSIAHCNLLLLITSVPFRLHAAIFCYLLPWFPFNCTLQSSATC